MAFGDSELRGGARNRARERGATAVEFALLGSVLLLLVFGVLEFGLAFNDYLSVRFGSQEAARQAAVGTTGGDGSCELSGDAAGAGTSTRELLCLAKERVGLDEGDTRVKVAFGATGYAEQGSLVVCVQYRLTARTGMFGPLLDGRLLRAQTRVRIEDLASPALEEGAESAPSGGDWSWCSVE